jgi:hypothetical protein
MIPSGINSGGRRDTDGLVGWFNLVDVTVAICSLYLCLIGGRTETLLRFTEVIDTLGWLSREDER